MMAKRSQRGGLVGSTGTALTLAFIQMKHETFRGWAKEVLALTFFFFKDHFMLRIDGRRTAHGTPLNVTWQPGWEGSFSSVQSLSRVQLFATP